MSPARHDDANRGPEKRLGTHWLYVDSDLRSVALFIDRSSRAERRMRDDQEFNWRNALELRNTIRRALGSPMACSDANCVIVRDTVSIVSPR